MESKKSKAGLLLLGQSPRPEFRQVIQEILREGIELIEHGALDGLREKELKKLTQSATGKTLVLKLADGSVARVKESHIIPLIKKGIEYLETQNCGFILVACTWIKGEYGSRARVLLPYYIIHAVVSSIIGIGSIGVLIPEAAQCKYAHEIWRSRASRIEIEVASPYAGLSNLKKCADKLKEKHVDLVVLDCFAYSQKAGEIVQKTIGKPALVPITLSANFLKALC